MQFLRVYQRPLMDGRTAVHPSEHQQVGMLFITDSGERLLYLRDRPGVVLYIPEGDDHGLPVIR